MADGPSAPSSDERTRDRVLRHVLEHGPVTAADVAEVMYLTPTAVRRHLEFLTNRGDLAPSTTKVAARGPGRPARAYVVTPTGHRRLGDDGDLAIAALHFLEAQLGSQAVADFARSRFAGLEERYGARLQGVGPDPAARAQALAEALSADGFAASARPVGIGTPLAGVQLCQGHCPLHRVAGDYPQFCEAETEAFARLLGVHVQRLATLANGEHVCTTFIPLDPVESGVADDAAPRDDRSDERTPR